jgi:shikimate kinase
MAEVSDGHTRPDRAYHILFIGFMGSGKTTVSKLLGRMLSRRVIDVDQLISRRSGKTIPELFELYGEEGFREREMSALESLLLEPPCIVSCGGGVCTRPENREMLKRLGAVVYLEVDADEAVSRISRPESRPLLSGDTPPAELLASRIADYEACATFSVDTSGKTPNEVCDIVGEELWRRRLL